MGWYYVETPERNMTNRTLSNHQRCAAILLSAMLGVGVIVLFAALKDRPVPLVAVITAVVSITLAVIDEAEDYQSPPPLRRE